MEISDVEFIHKIEIQVLDPLFFNHKGHVRLAWLYLRNFGLETAVEKICITINSYATSLGASTKFNKTMTCSLVYIMATRMNGEESWISFLDNNKDIRDDCYSLLLEYYDEKTLKKEKTKIEFIKPSLKTW